MPSTTSDLTYAPVLPPPNPGDAKHHIRSDMHTVTASICQMPSADIVTHSQTAAAAAAEQLSTLDILCCRSCWWRRWWCLGVGISMVVVVVVVVVG
eukprot:136668-Chlamydomonas_euryale.AAC.8